MSALAAAGAIAAGVGSVAGNLGGTIYSTERNIANSNYQVELQRKFEERMANTQYQRAIADMKAAGINPGSIGASMDPNSVPSSAAATSNYGHAADFSNLFSSAVSAAMGKDKNIANKVLQEMRDESALQVQRLRNQGRIENEVQKKEMGHAAYYRSKQDEKFTSGSKYKIEWDEL